MLSKMNERSDIIQKTEELDLSRNLHHKREIKTGKGRQPDIYPPQRPSLLKSVHQSSHQEQITALQNRLPKTPKSERRQKQPCL